MSRHNFRVGEPFNHVFIVEIKVDPHGIFYCNLDPATAKLFTDNGTRLEWNRRIKQGCMFQCDTLKGLKELIQAKIDEMCSVEEVSRETVITWCVSTVCSYCVAEDGSYVPNGGWHNVGGWHEGTVSAKATNRKPMGLQIYAQVEVKVTRRFKTSGRSMVVHERFDCRENSDDPVDWLAGLCSQEPPRGEPLHEIPATRENAQFFVDLYKSLFALNERIRPFITDEAAILKLIAGGGRLLSA